MRDTLRGTACAAPNMRPGKPNGLEASKADHAQGHTITPRSSTPKVLKPCASWWPYFGFFMNQVNPSRCAPANGLCLMVLKMSSRQEHFALPAGLCRVNDGF
jgi:hypothetical protein